MRRTLFEDLFERRSGVVNAVSRRIYVDQDTWLIMREFPAHPKAIIRRITDTSGDERFLVMVWHPDPAKQRLVGIYEDIEVADKSVPWPGKPDTPGPPGASVEEQAERRRRSPLNEFGYPKQRPYAD